MDLYILKQFKKAAVGLALVLSQPLLAGPIIPGQLDTGDPLVVDAANGLNLRPQPNSGKIGVIPDKTVIFATGEAEKYATGRLGARYWAPVKYQNENDEWIEGWVLLKHTAKPTAAQVEQLEFKATDDVDGIQKSVEQEPAPIDSKPVAAENAVLEINVKSLARLRTGPSSSASVFRLLRNDTKVHIVGKPKGNWIPVRVDGRQESGWVHMSLLNGEGDFNPYEVAQGHSRSADEVSTEIAKSTESEPTEAGAAKPCDSCRRTGLSKIPVPKAAAKVKTSGKGYIRPVSGPINSEFGRRRDPIYKRRHSHHGGIDFRVPTGTSVKAIRGGRIVEVKTGCRRGNIYCGGGWGNHVIIDHGNGIRSVYAHLSSVSVKVGQMVGQGGQIARSGSTGRSTGPHLHLEIHQNGVRKNPRLFL
ncbi:MAG: peptidoglycan DD-metalloendopeptidase family protein [Bdellovibrionales bacterium]|nr:peptidoglycan DD-metalloendopeptidase family protein [Bdellovibrionales bacterium]